eukprot:s3393_g4.t1
MVVAFTDSPIHLNAEAGYTAEQWHEWIRSLLAPQVSVARRAYEEKLREVSKGPGRSRCQAPTAKLAAATWLASIRPLLLQQQQQQLEALKAFHSVLQHNPRRTFRLDGSSREAVQSSRDWDTPVNLCTVLTSPTSMASTGRNLTVALGAAGAAALCSTAFVAPTAQTKSLRATRHVSFV